MEKFGTLVILVILCYCFWLLVQPQPVFLIRVRDGTPTVRKGQVPADVLPEIAEICQDCRVRSGSIRGVARGGETVLVFSGDISRGCQQRIRNVWNF